MRIAILLAALTLMVIVFATAWDYQVFHVLP
jgi:hypothetical protein